MKNIDIDHKVLARYFEKTNEAMRQLKKKWNEEEKGLWKIYVAAYNYLTKGN